MRAVPHPDTVTGVGAVANVPCRYSSPAVDRERDVMRLVELIDMSVVSLDDER